MATSGAFDIEDHVLGTLYGECAGDAIGLLAEFMVKKETKEHYSQFAELEFEHKVADMHRARWKTGDWTDDSDQMILIMDSITDNNGKIDPLDFAKRVQHWRYFGYKELGDHVGMGIGTLTDKVLSNKKYLEDPFKVAEEVWQASGCKTASNGAVMRTCIVGVHNYRNIDDVCENAKQICLTTHTDPRCVASCVAVSMAVALMLQRQAKHLDKKGEHYNIEALITESYKKAKTYLEGPNYKNHKAELKSHMFPRGLSSLKLDNEKEGIGYTYKTLGAGFWALRQQDFRTALQRVTMEGGDADTNGAVAGALLGCKLGARRLPETWRDKLRHKDWLDEKIDRYLKVEGIREATPVENEVETNAAD